MIPKSFNSRFNLTFQVTLSLTIFSSSFRRRSFVGSFRWSIWSPNKNHGNSTGNEFHKLWYQLTQIAFTTKKKEKIDFNSLFLTASSLSRSYLYVCFCLLPVFLPFTSSDWKHFPFFNWNIFINLIGLFSVSNRNVFITIFLFWSLLEFFPCLFKKKLFARGRGTECRSCLHF